MSSFVQYFRTWLAVWELNLKPFDLQFIAGHMLHLHSVKN